MPARATPDVKAHLRPPGFPLRTINLLAGVAVGTFAAFTGAAVLLGSARSGALTVAAAIVALLVVRLLRRDRLLRDRRRVMLAVAEDVKWATTYSEQRGFWVYGARRRHDRRIVLAPVTLPVDPRPYVQFVTAAPLPGAAFEFTAGQLRTLYRLRLGRAARALEHKRADWPGWVRRLPIWAVQIEQIVLSNLPPAYKMTPKALVELCWQLGELYGCAWRPSADRARDVLTLTRTAALPDRIEFDELPDIPGFVVLGRAQAVSEHDVAGAGLGIVWWPSPKDPHGPALPWLAFDPVEVPHGRWHGETGLGKTNLARVLSEGLLRYGAELILLDNKGENNFASYTLDERCEVPREFDDRLRALRMLYLRMQKRYRILNAHADTCARLLARARAAGRSSAELPPRPKFQPVAAIADELRALFRQAKDLDDRFGALPNGTTRLLEARVLVAELVQLGRAADVFLYTLTQQATVEGVGGANLDSESRANMRVVGHLGPVADTTTARVVFGGGAEVAAWAMGIGDVLGRIAVRVGRSMVTGQIPFKHDLIAHLPQADGFHPEVEDGAVAVSAASDDPEHGGSPSLRAAAAGRAPAGADRAPDEGGEADTTDLERLPTADEAAAVHDALGEIDSPI